MTKHNDPNFDSLLHGWAQQRAADKHHLDELKDRIASALERERFLDIPSASPRTDRRWLVPAVIGFCGGLAASLLLGAWLLRPVPPTVHEFAAGGPAPRASSMALWKPAELAEKKQVFTAIDAEFGGHLGWFAEHGTAVSLEVADPGAAPSDSPLAIRIVMLHRAPGDSKWSRVWSTDVVTHGEQLVRSLPGTSASSIWAYSLADGLIAVDGDLTLESPLLARVRFSGLFKSGVPGQVFSLKTADEEYQVFQTVAPLPDDAA
jgi:hypothetical protein